MKRLYASILAISLLVTTLASPLAHASANDFTFTSFEARYDLSRDSQNRSLLKVREDLVAEFPASDQNHGIERAIPKSYDGHPVNLHISSVFDKQGKKLSYTTYTSNDNLVVRIGDANAYVHGRMEYFIDYTAQDVTKSFDTGDEFYWDVNGTGWQQPFGTVKVTLHLDPSIETAFNKKNECFTGAQGSTAQNCTIGHEKAGQATIIAASATSLAAGENLSIVAGFQPGTFAPYVTPPLQTILFILLGLLIFVWYLVVPVIASVKAYRRWHAKGRDAAGRGTIIPQYASPAGVSVLLSDVIQGDRMRAKAVSAAIIDLAIRGYLKIYQTDKKNYEIELVKPLDDLQTEEQEVVRMLFGSKATVNQRIALKDKKNLYSQVEQLGKLVYAKAIDNGYMADTQAQQRTINLWGIILAVGGAFTINPLAVIAGVITIIFAYHMPARTEKGVELKEYLLGVRDYMKLAEADRIKVLQSPTGAEKIDTTDNKQLVKLYEKLLPLAMLFGIEKDWAKQFAGLYQQPPDWYHGNWSAFNAGVFVSSIGSFGSDVTASSFTPPASSSSSGFSGGGSSGGGGGGGGGGGW